LSIVGQIGPEAGWAAPLRSVVNISRAPLFVESGQVAEGSQPNPKNRSRWQEEAHRYKPTFDEFRCAASNSRQFFMV
jgi:hypothetical protein